MSNNLKFKDKIKLIISDFDGVFTDGSVYICDDGKNTYKKISYQDIMGVSILIKNNIDFVIISGEKSGAISYLKNKFPKIITHEGIRDKLKVLKDIINEYKFDINNVIYIGDDVNDIECLKLVGNKFTVENANYKVKKLDNIQVIKKNENEICTFRKLVDEVIINNEKFS